MLKLGPCTNSLINSKAPGQHSRLNDEQRAALAQAIERGPTPYLDGVVRWRLCDLTQWLWDDFRISASEQTLSREVRAMGYRKIIERFQRNTGSEGDVRLCDVTGLRRRPAWQAGTSSERSRLQAGANPWDEG
jgi:hypothetical protein